MSESEVGCIKFTHESESKVEVANLFGHFFLKFNTGEHGIDVWIDRDDLEDLYEELKKKLGK